MAWKCLDCGNTEEFYGIGAVSVTVYFDKYEHVTEIPEPDYKGHGASMEYCAACESENIQDVEEDNE